MDRLQKQDQTKKVLLNMTLHQSMIFPVESRNTPAIPLSLPPGNLLVTKVIGGWIYIIDYGTNSEPPIFIPESLNT